MSNREREIEIQDLSHVQNIVFGAKFFTVGNSNFAVGMFRLSKNFGHSRPTLVVANNWRANVKEV